MKFQLLYIVLSSVLFTQCDIKNIEEVKNEDGTVVERREYVNPDNKQDYHFTKFNDEGIKILTATYKDGVLDGERKIYFANGKTEQIETYVEGKFEGSFKSFHENGKVFQEGQYVDNAMNGVWKKYYENGNLEEEVMFKSNKEEGPFKEYYESGQLKSEGLFKDGDNVHGTLKLYGEDGELERILECDMGRCKTIEDYRKEKPENE